MKPHLRHFCTHALDDLIDYINFMGYRNGPFEQYTLELVSWLKQAVKFSYNTDQALAVPERVCMDWLTDEHPRLPYEFVAIEVEDGSKNELDKDMMNTVYVCADLQKIKHEIFSAIQADLDLRDDTGGFLVWPIVKPRQGQITYTGTHKWYPSPCLCVVLPAEEMEEWEANAPAQQKHISSPYGHNDEPCLFVQHLVDYDYTVEAILANLEKDGHKVNMHDPIVNASMTKQVHGLMESSGAALLRDTKIIASMFTLLECRNVIHRTLPAPRMLNMKRKKKKRTPFFEYKTLVIDPEEPRVVSPSLGPHRLRRSPKMHLRRGHIRRLANGGKTWVSPAMIGSKKRGLVLKDYEVKKT